MTGRGIDQVLPHPSGPLLYEPHVRDARQYVALAEAANGPIPQPVDFRYIWGDALQEWARMAPDARIINLETSVTRSDDYWRGKGINYRMHPCNILCLKAAGIHCCALANNHVLDWGYAGLVETLETLQQANILGTGAGTNLESAEAPGVLAIEGKGRVLFFSLGSPTSGIPVAWAATADRPGVNLLPDLSGTVQHVARQVQAAKQPGDVVVASIHWGGNWGYEVPLEQRELAHRLIDEAGVDVIHGHSSHHPKGIEVYKGRLILYGCGDFLNDYEGIAGYEAFRSDLSLMYFLRADPASGKLVGLDMTPTQVRRFRVQRASEEDGRWLQDTLNREGQAFGTSVEQGVEGRLILRWHSRSAA